LRESRKLAYGVPVTTTLSRDGRTSLEVGATFAGYRIEEVLGGRRSAGAVYVATCLDSGRPLAPAPWLPVALKVFQVDPDRPPWAPRVLDMARLQATLHHPNVVPIHEVDTSPAPFLSMALVRGPTLAELLESRGLDDPAALEIARRVASALEAGREHGLVYRDLRPSRVLLPGDDPRRACLGDFGAGRPEDVEADVASNVRSLASMLFQCLTFASPEHGARRLRELRADLPAELEDVLATALDDDPARRQASAGELMHAVGVAYPDPSRRRRRARAPRAGAPRASRLASPRVLVVALVMTCAAVAGAIIGASTAPEQANRAVRTDVLDTNSLTVRYPADWVRAGRVPDIPGLELREAVALTPPRGRPTAEGGRAVVVGSIGSWNPEMLTRVLSRLPGSPLRERVQLGALQGYRYSGVRQAGSGREVKVYVLATSANAIVVGCLAPPGSGAFMADCEGIASTLRPRHARPVALGVSPTYTRALRRILSELATARVTNRQRLQAAHRADRQAAAATRLSLAYREARRSAAGLDLPVAPELHSGIVTALDSAAAGYAEMASAARQSDQPSWDSGRRLVLSSERELQRRLRELRAVG
jgi:hypothetical protein